MLVMLLPASLLAQKGAPGPTNVTVVSNGSTATVSWTPVESRGMLYRVLRAPNETERGIDLTDPIEGVTFEDGKVEPGVTYFYQVVAVLADGTLAAAAPVAFTMGKSLRAPPMVAEALPLAPIPAPIALPPAPIAAPQMAPPAAQQAIAQPLPLQTVPVQAEPVQAAPVPLQIDRNTPRVGRLTPPPRWALRPDAAPSIEPNSKVLLFLHGMDSRAEEANDITKTLFMQIATTPVTAPPAAYPPITANRATIQFASPETCDNMDNFSNGQRSAVVPFDMVNGAPARVYFAPVIPPILLDTPPRAGTQFNVPAAQNIGANEGRLRPELRAVAGLASAQPFNALRQASFRFAAGDAVWGKAFADLSVTGHKAFAAFRQALPGEPFCQSLLAQPPPAPIAANDILNGCRVALDRAYRVANFLRTGQRGDTPALKVAKTAERNALGWIAVSGEDDSPHRPVNVPSSDFPQYDLQVLVEAPRALGPKVVSVHTRYTIAQSLTPGRNLVMISLDLPTSGYADNLNYNAVSQLNDIGQPKFPNDFGATGATPLLDFIETFVVRFAETLDQKVPFKNNIKAVMGGSLGGSMTFRLGRRANVPWLPKFVVWSPASIWESLGAGNDVTKHLGPRAAWFSADQAMNTPGTGDRAAFFGSWDKAIAWPIIPMAQSDTWTSNYYLCKMSAVAGARLDRQETFDSLFYAWHWRLGGEQLLFSHQNTDPMTNQKLFMLNQKPMLLACGLEDRVPYNDICPATMNTAQFMLTPGKALFLGQTGHSVDNERRGFWAQQMIGFLGL
jgi:hypothetical protein